ncbi:MAG: class I SAM-dependent methyltransferase [Vicinamibacteria bacterium]
MTDQVDSAAQEIREFYRKRATLDRYATSPDFNLREVENRALSRHLDDDLSVLDVGCGNGYSTLSYAAEFRSSFTGVDFVPEMVTAAKGLANTFALKGTVEFDLGDVTRLGFAAESFDVVCSQRCLLNLPTRADQWTALDEVARVLKPNGRYLMLEGTLQGLRALNSVRGRFGLEPIPEADPKSNWFSNKFDEDEMRAEALKRFRTIERVERFGMYYLISRVLHPLLVAPDTPKYDAPINAIARRICDEFPDFEGMGHVALFVLRR